MRPSASRYFFPFCRQPSVWKAATSAPVSRSIRCSQPSEVPKRIRFPARAGEEKDTAFIGWSKTPLPVAASRALKRCPSEVGKYTRPPCTAGEAMTQPLRLSCFQSSFPVAASSA